MALQSSHVDESAIAHLMDRLAQGLREGGRATRWLLYSAAIKSMTRGRRASQLLASLGLLATLAGEAVIVADTSLRRGGTHNGSSAEEVDQSREVLGAAPGLEQVLAGVFEGGRVEWSDEGRETRAEGSGEGGGGEGGDDRTGGSGIDGERERLANEAAVATSGGEDGEGSSPRTAHVWVGDTRVVSVTYADVDGRCGAGDLSRDLGVVFRLAEVEGSLGDGSPSGGGGGVDAHAMAAQTHAELAALGRSETANGALSLSLQLGDVEAALQGEKAGRDGPEDVLLSHATRVFLSHIRLMSAAAAAGRPGRASRGITDDQAAQCAHVLKVAVWAGSRAEVTLRDCVLLQYLIAKPGFDRKDANVAFQAFAWREATGRDAEGAAVSAVAVGAAAETAEAAVARVEEVGGKGNDCMTWDAVKSAAEGSLVGGVSTPHCDDVTSLVDRILASADSPGEDGASKPKSAKLNAYAQVVRDRTLGRLEAGALAEAAEHQAALKMRSVWGARRHAAAADGKSLGGVAPLVLVSLIAPSTAVVDSHSWEGVGVKPLQVGDVGVVVPPRVGGSEGNGAEGSGTLCVADWWGGNVRAGVHWSDVELLHPFQVWMSLPVVCHARECLEAAAAALLTEHDKCAAAEEVLWAGHRKFLRKCGGEGTNLWVSGEHESALFAEFVDHIIAPARAVLVPPAERIAAAQLRMILAEATAIDRGIEPLARWCAMFPRRRGAPRRFRDRVRAMIEAARTRVRDLREDMKQLRLFCDTAGLSEAPPEFDETLGAVCFLGEKLDIHTTLWPHVKE